jgi:DNA-binding MarR family transcriptional regulator
MGLIVRKRSKEDERKVIVNLTAKGSEMRSGADEILRRIFAAADLPAPQFSKLTRDIQALRRNLEHAAKA